MRKTKTIKIDDREITVKELRVKDIREIFERGESIGEGIDQFTELLPLATDLSLKDANEMAPSELKIIWEAFREVNAVFFDAVAKAGIVDHLKTSILTELTAAFATSLAQGTDSKTS